jgi:hypothetical protein
MDLMDMEFGELQRWHEEAVRIAEFMASLRRL